MRNNRDRSGHVYIFLIWKQKLIDLANNRPSVCLCVRKTFKSRADKDNKVRFFYLESIYWESKLPKFQLERTMTYEV